MQPTLKENSEMTDEVLYYKGDCKKWGGRWHERSPYHPYRVNREWVQRSRRRMERYLGRFLEPDEIVHHCDENPENDKIKNLELVNQMGHNEIHNQKQPPMFPDEIVLKALEHADYSLKQAAEDLGVHPRVLWGGKYYHLYQKRNSPHFLKKNRDIVCSSCKEVGMPKTAKIFGTNKTTLCHNLRLWQNEGLIPKNFLDSVRVKKPAGYVDEHLGEIRTQTMELGFEETGRIHDMNPESIRCAFRRLTKAGVLPPEFVSQVIENHRQRMKLQRRAS